MKTQQQNFTFWEKNPTCECVFFLNYFHLEFSDILLLRSIFKQLNIKATLVGPKYIRSNYLLKYRSFIYGKCIMGVTVNKLSILVESLTKLEVELTTHFKDMSFYGVFINNVYFTINNIKLSLNWILQQSKINIYKDLFFLNNGFLYLLFKNLGVHYYYKHIGILHSLIDVKKNSILNRVI